MSSPTFVKYHALGNDYFVLHPSVHSPMFSPIQIERICHRNFGLGSDGILYGPLESSVADFRMEIWNPDGTEAEKSGNGLRIFARFLYDEKLVQMHNPFTVETLGGIATCTVLDKQKITVQLGKISFHSSKIPVTGPLREVCNESIELLGETYSFYAATIGNPHVVLPMDNPTKEIACRLGPLIETNTALFPNKTNVQFLSVQNRATIRIEIWERGAGYTLASGSSSSAAAAVAVKMGACDRDIAVHCPGGIIQIHVDEQFNITMTASVCKIGSLELDAEIFKLVKE